MPASANKMNKQEVSDFINNLSNEEWKIELVEFHESSPYYVALRRNGKTLSILFPIEREELEKHTAISLFNLVNDSMKHYLKEATA